MSKALEKVSAVGLKVLASIAMLYALYLMFRAGAEEIAIGIAIAGGITAIGTTIADWRRGIKPWDPKTRVDATDEFETDAQVYGAYIGRFLGRVSAMILIVFAAILSYRAGHVVPAAIFIGLGAVFEGQKLWADLKAGRKPWVPTESVRSNPDDQR